MHSCEVIHSLFYLLSPSLTPSLPHSLPLSLPPSLPSQYHFQLCPAAGARHGVHLCHSFQLNGQGEGMNSTLTFLSDLSDLCSLRFPGRMWNQLATRVPMSPRLQCTSETRCHYCEKTSLRLENISSISVISLQSRVMSSSLSSTLPPPLPPLSLLQYFYSHIHHLPLQV